MNISFVEKKKIIIIIVGPTAVGKTALTVQLAKELNCQIISADSRQFYKELSIGTAKPSTEEMQGVVHHFVDSHSINDYFSVGDYAEQVQIVLKNIFKTNDLVILTGGSGLFIKAALYGIDDLPKVDLKLRGDLMKKLENDGIEWFQEQLKNLDVDTYNTIEIKNTQRVFRAVEVCLQTGKPFASFLGKNQFVDKYNFIKIGIDRPREELYERINLRVDQMIKFGLIDEVKLYETQKHINAFQTVGYKEIFQFLSGEITKEQAIENIKLNTRRYSKRQLTWFRNQDVFKWFHPNDYDLILEYIKKGGL